MPPLASPDLFPLASAFLPPALGAVASDPTQVRAGNFEGDVSAQTGTIGALTVRGKAKILESGALASGQTAYNTGTGFYIEANGGNPRFSLGNPATNSMTWDGSTLAVTGSMTATSGAIGGWTVNTTNLAGGSATLDSSGFLNLGIGNNIVKASATDATYRLWVGNATAASAPFSVDKTGALLSSSGSIGGWSITSSALQLGSASTQRGIDSGATAFYAGSSTPSSAPFRVTTAGALTASNINVTGGTVTANAITTGTLNFGSSGTVNTTGSVTGTFGGLNLANLTVTGSITLGSGGSIVDADGSTWDQTGITLVSSGTFGDSIVWKSGGSNRASIYTSTTSATFGWNATNGGYVSIAATSATLGVAGSSLPQIIVGTAQINVAGQIHPGPDTGGTQTGRYIDVDAANTFLRLTTPTLRITGNALNAIIRMDAVANGGSASNWSSFTVANVPDKSAGYFKVNIGGTNYRVAFWADA